jgi:hypothetical protein
MIANGGNVVAVNSECHPYVAAERPSRESGNGPDENARCLYSGKECFSIRAHQDLSLGSAARRVA